MLAKCSSLSCQLYVPVLGPRRRDTAKDDRTEAVERAYIAGCGRSARDT